jgi:hypothetical protein
MNLPTTDIQHWAPIGFNPDVAICRVIFSQIKTAPHEEDYGPYISCLYEIFFHHAAKVDRAEKYNTLLQELCTELDIIVRNYGLIPSDIVSNMKDEAAIMALSKADNEDFPLSMLASANTVEGKVDLKGPEKPLSSFQRLKLKFCRKK